MSGRRKNHHYHYAEKFEDSRRRSERKRAFMPFKSVIISLVVLLMFGLVSTTFSVYVSESESDAASEYSPIISEMRSLKGSRDIALTGANVDLASSGATWSFSGTSYIYFDNKTTKWSGAYFYLVIGKDGYSSTYEMKALSKTDYYYCQLPSSGWDDANYMAIAVREKDNYNSGSWGSGNISSSNFKYYSGTYTAGVSTKEGQRYLLTPSSSQNGCSLSLSNNDSLTTVSLTLHSCYTDNGTSYTVDSDTAGTVNITGYYMSNNTTVSSNSTGESASASYNSVRTNSSDKATFSAESKTGYRFAGFYTASTGGSLVSAASSYTYDVNSGDKEIYARFIKQVTVSVAKSPAEYTGAPSASPSTAVDVGTEVTLSADVKTGVDFGDWSTSSGAAYTTTSGSSNATTWTIKPTSSFTATASYTLQVPTNVSLSYPAVVAGESSTPTKSAVSPAGANGTLSYSFTNITPASGTTAASGTYSVNSSTGEVTASVPGRYTVTMSVTNTAYGLTSAASTATATVIVKPAAPTGITCEVTNADSGNGTYDVPYKTPVDRTKFTIHSYIPVDDRKEGYTYKWTRTDGTYVIAEGTITPGTHSVTTEGTYEVSDTASDCTQPMQVIHNTTLAETQGYIYKIAVTVTYNGVESDPYYYTVYYGVTADFLVVESFDFKDFNASRPIQKVYAEDNNITGINAVYDAGGTNTFNTMLWFSNDNIDFKKVAVWAPNTFRILSDEYSAFPNNAEHTTSALVELIKLVTCKDVNLMSTTGPKWFKGYVDDYNNSNIGAQYPELHTTVGTSSTVSNRPIYYVDKSAVTHTNSRVMAFFTRGSDDAPTVHYQTAQKVSGRNNTYRFYIPSDAELITFAHVAENNYVLPTVSGSTFSYPVYSDNKVLMAWTDAVDLSDPENTAKTAFEVTGSTQDSGTGIYNYSGTLTTLE